MNNWLSKALQIIAMVPGVVQGIEALKGEAESGTTKKQLALDALGFGSAVAQAAAPSEQANIQAASAFVGSVVDSSVALFNQTGWFHTPPATPAAPTTK